MKNTIYNVNSDNSCTMNISTQSMKDRTDKTKDSLSIANLQLGEANYQPLARRSQSPARRRATFNSSLLTAFAVLLCLLFGGKAWGQTTATCYPPTQTYATGYTNGSTKNSGDMNTVSNGGVQGWMMFDVSSIPNNATINSIELHFYSYSTSTAWVKLTSAGELNPITASASVLYNAITDASTNYYTSDYISGLSSAGWKTFTLSNSAISNLQTHGLSNDYFTIGFYEYESGSYNLYAYGYDSNDYKPYIIITYTSSCPTTISTRSDWNAFCDCVNNGHDYAGETVTLTADVAGVANMAGTSSSHPFKGTFDGGGHTLTVAIIGNNTQGQAPFQNIQGATIKNLVVGGTVTATPGGYPHAAGLVGFALSGGGNNTIENCLVHTNVTNNGTSGNTHIGGIVGHGKEYIELKGCVYDGLLTSNSSATNYIGGLVGWTNNNAVVKLTNCLFNGTVSNTTSFHPIGCSNSPGSIQSGSYITNCYYYATNVVSGQLADNADKAIVNNSNLNKGKRAYTVTGESPVTVDMNGSPTNTYNVSGITAYSTGIKYDGTIYGGSGDNLSLSLSGSSTGYSADHGTLSGSSNPYTLAMEAYNTKISASQASAVWMETTTITPGEDYLIGFSDNGNVYLAVNYCVGQTDKYYTNSSSNYYGYTALAAFDGNGYVTGCSGYATDLQYCTWKFSTASGGTIQSGYQDTYYLNTWSSTSYADLYPNSSTSNGTGWTYDSGKLYRTISSTNRYAQYYSLNSTPHMRVTSDVSATVKLYTKQIQIPTTHTVSTVIHPTAGGSATGAGSYAQGASCTLAATANTGYKFVNWTASDGSVVSSNANYTFSVTGDVTYQANFTKTTATPLPWTEGFEGYTVTSGNWQYLNGEWATPTRWTKAPSVCYYTAAAYQGNRSLEFRAASATNVVVLPQFNEPLNNLIVSFQIGRGNTASGYTVKLGYVTDPSNASTFTELTDVSTPSGAVPAHTQFTYDLSTNSNSPSNSSYRLAIKYTTTNMEDSWYLDDFNVRVANYTLTTSVTPSEVGSITISPSPVNGTYAHGTQVQLTAPTNSCYTFNGWTVDGSSAGSTNPYTITMNADHSVVANFTLNTYTVSVSANPSEGGTVSGGGTFDCGTSPTVTATANTGYNFVNWTEGGSQVSTNTSYTISNISADHTLVANFEAISSGGDCAEVQIGDGTSTGYYLPVNMYYNYSLTEQIYTAAEIGDAGIINSISFEYTHTASFSMDNIKVYMLNTNKSSFSSNTDMVAIGDGDKVFEGTFSATGSGWVTIDLDNPFAYTGENLLVAFYDATDGYPGSAYKFKYTGTGDNYTSCYYYSDTYTPDLSNINSFSGIKNYQKYHNNIKFCITPACEKLSAPTFSVTPGLNKNTLSWSNVANNQGYKVQYATNSSFTTGVGTADIAQNATSWVHNGSGGSTYYYRMLTKGDGSTYCAEGDYSGEQHAQMLSCTSLSAPTNVSASAIYQGANVSWNAVANASSYTVYWGTTDACTGGSHSGITGTSHEVTGLTPGTPYYFKVMAVGTEPYCSDNSKSSAVSATPVSRTVTVSTETINCVGAGSTTLRATVSPAASGLYYTWSASPSEGAGLPQNHTDLTTNTITVTPTAAGNYTYTCVVSESAGGGSGASYSIGDVVWITSDGNEIFEGTGNSQPTDAENAGADYACKVAKIEGGYMYLYGLGHKNIGYETSLTTAGSFGMLMQGYANTTSLNGIEATSSFITTALSRDPNSSTYKDAIEAWVVNEAGSDVDDLDDEGWFIPSISEMLEVRRNLGDDDFFYWERGGNRDVALSSSYIPGSSFFVYGIDYNCEGNDHDHKVKYQVPVAEDDAHPASDYSICDDDLGASFFPLAIRVPVGSGTSASLAITVGQSPTINDFPASPVSACGSYDITATVSDVHCNEIFYTWGDNASGDDAFPYHVENSGTYSVTVTSKAYRQYDMITQNGVSAIVANTEATIAVPLTDGIGSNTSAGPVSADATLNEAIIVNGGTIISGSREGFEIAGGVCQSTASVSVTIDNTAPELTGLWPSNITDQDNCMASRDISELLSNDEAAARYTDDNGGAITVTSTDEVSGDDCSWTITRTYTIKDACDNTVTPAPTMSVSGGDNSDPALTGIWPSNPSDQEGCMGSADLDALLATNEAIAALYTDCSGVTVTHADETTGDNCSWTSTRTFTITDGCNHSVTKTQSVSGGDQTDPVITDTNLDRELTSTNCTFIVPNLTEEVRNIASDNCTDQANLVITQNITPGDEITTATTVMVTVTDLCGNSSTKPIQLTLPELLTASLSAEAILCNDGTVDIINTVEGGTADYTFVWNTGAASQNLTGVHAGTYSVTVTDANGCTAVPTITISEPTALTTSLSTEAVSCNGGNDGSISVSVSGGTPEAGDMYYYSNDGGTSWTDASVSPYVFAGLTAGNYDIAVKDKNGCIKNCGVMEVTQPDVFAAGSIASADTTICCGLTPNAIRNLALPSGGDGSYTYQWQYSTDGGSSWIDISSNTTTYVPEEIYVTTWFRRQVKDATCQTEFTESDNIYKVTVSTPSVTGFSDGDFVWSGNADATNWSNAGNWLVYNATTSMYSAAGSQPTTSDNVYLVTYGDGCSVGNPTLTDVSYANNLTIGAGKSINLSDNSLTLAETLNNEGTFNGNAGTLSLAGDLNNNGIFNSQTGEVVFSGTSQTISNSATLELYDVHFNQSSVGTIIAPNGITVNNQATFTQGVVLGDMIFIDGASASGANLASYVDGLVTKKGNGLFTFPTGSKGVLGTIEATVVNNTDEGIKARFNNASADGHGYTTEAPDNYPRWWNINDMCGDDNENRFDHVSNFEYWKVEGISGDTKLTSPTLKVDATTAGAHFHDGSQQNAEAINAAAHYDCWKNMGGSANVENGGNTITISGMNDIKYTRSGAFDGILTLGSVAENVVLPIELLSFTATCDGRSALVEWTTTTERNNDYFVLERSDDAINFTEVARVAGAGNSIDPIDYAYTDYGIHGGDNYYRLVQVDYDGTRAVSEVVVVNCIETAAGEPDVQAYPNPFDGELTLELDNFDNRPARIDVYDMLGKLIYTDKVASPQNYYETVLNLSNLPPATYTVRVSTADFVINRKVVKQ